LKILGIETSCDETAAAVVEDGWNVLSNTIHSSAQKHNITGGIVPEVAARDAEKMMLPIISSALQKSKCTIKDVDAIAVSSGPGLLGSLLVGIETAKTLAYIHNKPLIPVHHVIGHIYSNRLLRKEAPDFPVIVLTVSGGHNEIVIWEKDFSFRRLGETVDDSAGEALDKAARILGLGFPGGPEIAKLAKKGYEKAYDFPRPMIHSENFQFSFSGLKTALLYKVKDLGGEKTLDDIVRADLAASFQEAVMDTLSKKLFFALKKYPNIKEVHLSGGVSANQRLRQKIFLQTEKMRLEFHFPETLQFCTDNAAMIAGAGYWKHEAFPENDWSWRNVNPKIGKEFF
jgi:N6-L-threonylcarbamoyladenine synthase